MDLFIEEKAERLLISADCYTAPIQVDKCAQYLNIELRALELDENVSGFLLIKEKTAHIGYNKADNKKRQRFTIAHEIAHFILHDKSSTLYIDKSNGVFFRDINSSTGELRQEREANSFAASLLMPRKLVSEELQKIKTENKDSAIKKLSHAFNVSEQAMTIRLNNLGLIDYDAFI